MTARGRLLAAVSATVLLNLIWATAPAPAAKPPGYDQEPQAFFPSSVSFPDRDHGWAFNARCNHATWCTNELWATSDGGDTWTKARPPAIKWYQARQTRDPATGAIVSVAFADERNGWLFDPSLFVTHDGGRTWNHEAHDGPIVDLTAKDGWVWALEIGACPGPAYCPPNARILRSPATARLQPLDVQPPGLEHARQLVATGPDTAYVVVSPSGGRDYEVLATDDGGTTWRRAPAPCRGEGVRIEPLSPTHLWIRCSRVHLSSVHAQSFDGGRTWAPAPSIATRRYATGPVAAGDGSILYEKGDGEGLRRSADGGATDGIVFESRASAGGRGFIKDIVRADRDHLWMVTVALEGPRPTRTPGSPSGPVLPPPQRRRWAVVAYRLRHLNQSGPRRTRPPGPT